MTDERPPSPATFPGIEIREATTDAERQEIFRLRYRVIVDELGLYADKADHERKQLSDADDTPAARLLYAVVDGRVVGAVRAHFGSEGPLPAGLRATYEVDRFLDLVPASRMSILTRFMVAADQRGSMLPLALLLRMMELHVAAGIVLSFCDCEAHLVSLYSRLGMRTYAAPFNDTVGRLLVPMIGLLDRTHLERIGSPMLAFITPPAAPPELAAAVADRIGASRAVQSVEHITDPAEWVALYAALTGHAPHAASLLDGLTEDETRTVLAHGQLLTCERGACIIQAGHASRTMFVVLEGTVEVRDAGRVVATMGERAVFGEVAFLLGSRRISDVYAASDRVRILTLSEGTLRELLRSESSAAAKVLLNLARSLAVKLTERHALLSAGAP